MANKLIIQNNKTCKIELADNPGIVSNIRKALSYQQVGYEYTEAFKRHGWNGMCCLFTSKGAFPSGLQSKVESLLKENNIVYEVVDKRDAIKSNKEIDISKKLKSMNIVPRDYQIQTIDTICKHNKAIARLATGAGKSCIIAMLAAKLNKSTIVFVNSLSLLKQFYDTFSQIFEGEVGYIGDGECVIKKFNIVSVWTAATALGLKSDIVDKEISEKEIFKDQNKKAILELLKTAKTIIIDECHAARAQTIKNIYKVLNFDTLYSFSATPFSDEGMELVLTGMLGEQVVNVSAGELIKKNILVQPIIKFFNVPPIDIYGKDYHTIYNQYIVENDIRNSIIVNQSKKLIDKGYKPLVLFKNIAHGKILFDLFKEKNIRCDLLSGVDGLERREEVKQKFNNDEIDVIIASSIFTVGIDIPKLSALVNASGNKGFILTIQKVGRILRSYPGKKYAAVVDFIDNCRYLKNHSRARYKIYTSEEGFLVEVQDIKK